jgi:hypothetical protein
MSTCRFCWQPIVSAGLWVHTGTRRAGCEGGPLPIAEPVGPAPAVQGALFDLPLVGRMPALLGLILALTLTVIAGCQNSPTNPGLVEFTAACDQNHHAYDVRPATIAARTQAQKDCQSYTGRHLGPGTHGFGLMPSVDPAEGGGAR